MIIKKCLIFLYFASLSNAINNHSFFICKKCKVINTVVEFLPEFATNFSISILSHLAKEAS